VVRVSFSGEPAITFALTGPPSNPETPTNLCFGPFKMTANGFLKSRSEARNPHHDKNPKSAIGTWFCPLVLAILAIPAILAIVSPSCPLWLKLLLSQFGFFDAAAWTDTTGVLIAIP